MSKLLTVNFHPHELFIFCLKPELTAVPKPNSPFSVHAVLPRLSWNLPPCDRCPEIIDHPPLRVRHLM